MSGKGGFLRDETGALSSKRLMGMAAGFTLCAMGLAQAFSPLEVTVDGTLVEALTWVTLGGLGFASLDKFSARRTAPKEGADA